MKIGIVGTGLIINEFLPFLSEIDGLEIKALCGTQRSQEDVVYLCEKYQIEHGETDYNEFLKLDIDTVYIAVPNFLHFSFCMQALNAGKNVIVEKPMTSNLSEALRLQQAALEKQLFLFEAITTIYLENYRKVQELLPQIGKVKIVQCNYSQYSRRYDAFVSGEVLPVFDPLKSGGALMDLNLYNIHYVMGLFGEPVEVEYNANIERGIDTSGILTMQYPGFQAVCIAAKDCAAPARSVIQGTKGYIIQDSSANVCGEIKLHFNNGEELKFDDSMGRHRVLAEFEAFVEMIQNNDLKKCYDMLEHSVAVSRVQTLARKKAGIVFPADA